MADKEYFQGGLGLRVGDVFLDQPLYISEEPYRVDALDAEGYPVKVTFLPTGTEYSGPWNYSKFKLLRRASISSKEEMEALYG